MFRITPFLACKTESLSHLRYAVEATPTSEAIAAVQTVLTDGSSTRQEKHVAEEGLKRILHSSDATLASKKQIAAAVDAAFESSRHEVAHWQGRLGAARSEQKRMATLIRRDHGAIIRDRSAKIAKLEKLLIESKTARNMQHKTIRSQGRHIAESHSKHTAAVRELNATIEKLSNSLTEQEKLLMSHLGTIAGQGRYIEESAETIGAQNQLLEWRFDTIAKKETVIQELKQTIGRLRNDIEAKQELLHSHLRIIAEQEKQIEYLIHELGDCQQRLDKESLDKEKLVEELNSPFQRFGKYFVGASVTAGLMMFYSRNKETQQVPVEVKKPPAEHPLEKLVKAAVEEANQKTETMSLDLASLVKRRTLELVQTKVL